MDPNACYRRLLEEVDGGCATDIEAAADDLMKWLDGGGFMPAPDTLGLLAPLGRAGLRAVLDLIRVAAGADR